MTALWVRRPAELARLGQRHAVVEASAGTGKTYVLEHLVIDLLLRRQAELEQILVVTFTEKATAELVQRVRQKIAQLAHLTPDDPLARAAGAGASGEDCWLIDEQARARLRRALLSFDRATISTIHGFCQRLLAEHAFDQQRLFDEQVIDEGEVFHDAFVEVVREAGAPGAPLAAFLTTWLHGGNTLAGLENLLGRAQRELACLHPPRPGALRPPPLDPVAFSEALAGFPEVRDDDATVKAAMKAHGINASTIRASLGRLAALSRVAAAHREGAPAIACLAQLDAAEGRKADPELLGWLAARLTNVPETGTGLGRLVGQLRRLAAATVPLSAEMVHRLLPLVSARLEARKRQTGVFDFQDMLSLVARSLEGDGARARALRARLRARFRYALIDEFQDTDEVQWSIFRNLFVAGGDGERVLTVIGDPKQAIYGFRGADVGTYLRARAEITAGGAAAAQAPLYLTANFRSTAPLLRACNALLDQQASPPFFRPGGGITYDHPVECGRPEMALTGAGGPDRNSRVPSLRSGPAGAPAPPVVVLDIRGEGALLTWQIKQALRARMVEEIRALLDPDGGRGLRLGAPGAEAAIGARDIYVLTRTTRESREVGDALGAAGIPFAYFKQEHLFDTKEAREVLDVLRAIADPEDHTARARAWITPFFGLSLPDLAACEDLPPWHPLVRLLHEWKALADAGQLEALFARLVEQSGIVCREVFAAEGERPLTNYLHVLELLQEEAARSRCTIRELAVTLGAYVSGARRPPGQNTDIQRLETDARAVQVMTIHHAKGLEAAVVFVYGGIWTWPRQEVRALHDDEQRRVVRVGRPSPDDERRIADEQDDEERRVLYVALTRARGRLYLPRYPATFKYLRGPYRFVNQRLDDLLGAFTPPEVRALFDVSAVPCPAPPAPAAAVAAAEALAAWQPPAGLLDAGEDERAARAARAIAETRAGFFLTSYSAIKRRQGVPVEVAGDDPAASDRETGRALDVPLPADELPRGRLSGSFLHEVLEEVALAPLAASPPEPVDTWCARPEVAALFERVRRRHDRAPAHLPHGHLLVHTALTAPVRLGGDRVLPSMAAAARVMREMEFLYPIPERAHPLLGGAARVGPDDGRAPWRAERGLVKGFIDLLFEDEGRVYVCDWKGDWLPTWDAAAVAAHCHRHYQAQARLYTLAALRLCGIASEADHRRRFGGVLYCFLRARRPGDATTGVHFHAPAWEEVLTWQDEMLGNAFWGLG